MSAYSPSSPPIRVSQHYEFIVGAVDETFKTATARRGQALATTPLKIDPWYTAAPPTWLDKLALANLKAWRSQNQVDVLLDKVDLYTFAEPLLKAMIKARHGLELDVKTTFLRLYLPKALPWYSYDFSKGATTRTVSLLDAALHNFSRSEYADPDSDFISEPDARGLFDILPVKKHMSVSEFQQLSRELDIGAQYKKHLESYLLPGEPLAERVLQYKVNESQKDALAVAAHLALLTEDIQYDAYKMLLDLAADKPQMLLNGRAMRCCDLSMLDTRLTGILLLIHAVRDNRGVRRLIAYVPNDPDHPLKEYDSLAAFRDELTRQLRDDRLSRPGGQTYRQFFSQFVDQQQRGHFFAELEQRLFTVEYTKKTDPVDSQPPWRKTPVAKPNLRFQRLPLQGNYWNYAYRQKLNKILNDAREIAVSTAYTDSKTRWAWWDNFKKILSDIFNAALLVAAPFVPGLGELMMAYTVYQLTTDVVEGLVDLAEGLWQEVADHVIGVVNNLLQLAGFAVGGEIAGALKLKLSPVIEGMKPVKLPNGKSSLWHPDLGPYEQKKPQLPAFSQPDSLGLHHSGGEQFLPLDGKLYKVEKASPDPLSRTHRIKHPARPNAYQPKIEHNGFGAWRHEAESPANWEDALLMRRLGHPVESFSASELDQIRISSGTAADDLRRMHTDSSPPPPLLADTIKRFTARDEAQAASTRIRQDEPVPADAVWLESIITGLPDWPANRALKVFENGYSRVYGNPTAGPADTLSISLTDLNAGQLAERLPKFLSDTESAALLGRELPQAQRTQAFRDLWADAVQARQDEVAGHLYRASQRSSRADVRIVRQAFPELPLSLSEKLLAEARPTERQRIAEEKRLPLRLKAQGRELAFEAEAARAYTGFYADSMLTMNTERLALNTLRVHSDTFADLRIEVRSGTFDGEWRCSVGPEDASEVRWLIRDELGQYEVADANHHPLHEPDDFYQAILHALPADKRAALGDTSADGGSLKAWIMEQSAAPAERRTALAQPPIRPTVSLETERLVRGWPKFFRRPTPEQRVSQLHPNMNAREVTAFVNALQAKGDLVEAIDRLENDLEELRQILRRWGDSYDAGLDGSGEPNPAGSISFLRDGGRQLEDQLLDCFQRKSAIFGERNSHPDQGYVLDLSSELNHPDLDRWWLALRRQPDIGKHLDKVAALKLDNTRWSNGESSLLHDFSGLRQLSARQCDLSEIPSAIGQMRQLENLDLSDNRIALTPAETQRLATLDRLQTLTLTGNPLRQPPDIGRMDALRRLDLASTGLSAWPEGLFKLGERDIQRPRGFALDLRNCPIDSLPEVAAGSDQAFILSRTRFDTKKLAEADRSRYGSYRESVGFTREQTYSQAATDELVHWQRFPDDASIFRPTVAFKQYREESWHDVMTEPGAADLLRVIHAQRRTRDFQSDASRRQLTKRVWEMIDAAAVDSQLREELFKLAREPDSCRDGGAQLFNSLGLKVLVSRAYTEATSPAALETRLVRLARSAARLDRVADAAREEIHRQRQRNLIDPTHQLPPDDLEVHLAFETGLAERLQLPWRSSGMLYEARSGVDQTIINAAYDSIMAREMGDGLIDKVIDLDGDSFWERYLRNTYPDRFRVSDDLAVTKLAQLDRLREAQQEWVTTRDPAELNRLTREIEQLAQQLGIAQTELFEERPMDDARFNSLLAQVSHGRNDLARQLTREALQKPAT